MKVEFYYSKRQYSCSLTSIGDRQELRIKNDRGAILAIEQGASIGLLGKTRKDAREVDVSQAHYYNLIKAAVNAWRLSELDRKLQNLQTIVMQKDSQIVNLNRQIDILQKEHSRLSQDNQQQLERLQAKLKQQESTIQQSQQKIVTLSTAIEQLPPVFDLETVKKQIIANIGPTAWSSLAKISQKELCDAYRQYQLIDAETFTASVTDYSAAGLGLCLVAERELLKPFFKELYKYLVINNPQRDRFTVGEIPIKARSKNTLGDLPRLLSWQWLSLRREILSLNQEPPPGESNYRTVFFGNNVSKSDRLLIHNFLTQWRHPLATWFSRGEYAASVIDEIRLLRNRVTHHGDMFYLWQFHRLRLLIIGSKTKAGILKQIYD